VIPKPGVVITESLCCTVVRMDEVRSERFSISLTPSMLAKLDAFAAEHRWTRSTAAAVLIEEGLEEDQGEDHGTTT
jgi:metal-responsive CopG/Arc/MetJ family transcriptional regulator